eukprot:gene12282-18360_t
MGSFPRAAAPPPHRRLSADTCVLRRAGRHRLQVQAAAWWFTPPPLQRLVAITLSPEHSSHSHPPKGGCAQRPARTSRALPGPGLLAAPPRPHSPARA